ncbi:MAG: ribosomal protein S18-alanine N-acetyltransferase [Desulforhopalus sp.]
MDHDDIAAIAEIESEALSPWSVASLAAELHVSYGGQFVAELKSAIVGWCCFRLIEPEAELCKIVVKREYRRQGVASSLIDWVITELQSQKIKTLLLEVRASNIEGISFYQDHNFLQVGIRPKYYSNPPDSALIFNKTVM